MGAIFKSVFTHDTQVHPLASWYAVCHKIEFLFGFGVCGGILNNTMHVQNIVQLILLSSLQQIDNILFQQDNAHPCDTHATQHTLPDV